jgi:hypothetical protein
MTCTIILRKMWTDELEIWGRKWKMINNMSSWLGVSQYTGKSVYCNKEQNYIVSLYKDCIPVFSDTLCKYYFSCRLLVFYNTLIRITGSSVLLIFFIKIEKLFFKCPLHLEIVYKLEGKVQHADGFLCSFGLFLVIIFHGNVLQYDFAVSRHP